jgi:hypothetical protein
MHPIMMPINSLCRTALTIGFITACFVAMGQEFSEQELADAKEDRTNAIRRLADGVSVAEKSKRNTKDPRQKEAITARIAELKRALNEAKRKTPEDYAAKKREESAREQDELAAKQRRMEAEAEADAARMKINGNCPLRVDFATFAHLSDVDSIGLFHDVDPNTTLGLTPLTAIVFEVTNRSTQDVEAWEMTYELLDGFDEVLYAGQFRNPLVSPGDHARARISAPHVPQAVQMRIHVERAKSRNGTLWQRMPEHKEVGLLVRKLEGADFFKNAKP